MFYMFDKKEDPKKRKKLKKNKPKNYILMMPEPKNFLIDILY